ncbi:MAG TPA: helix-hairpin-helix domain-containing protein [Acidimicrobiales bacterium]|nr:helix-hairpin-helix domain-containing protein [Acidimicrobiales bacterium]
MGLPPPVEAPSLAGRVGAVADALGTSAARLVAGCVVGLAVAGLLAWTLVGGGGGTSERGSGRVDEAALPRAASAVSGSNASSDPVEVVVDAAGALARPGVYRLGPTARVQDVVAAAGGPAPDADLELVNLAAPVADGERVYVPRRGERAPEGVATGPLGAGGWGSLGSRGGVARLGPPAQPVNLNSASAEQLDALPGIGPATARAIVAWRQQHGRFKRVDDLLAVRGIGPAKLVTLRPQVRV